jgi:hypothetical protein
MSAPSQRSILYCHCAYAQVVPAETKAAVLEQLSAAGVSFEAVPDLCEMSARRDACLAEIASTGAAIVACYPRAVRWLFEAAGAPLPPEARILNMRAEGPAEILAALALTSEAEVS